MCLPPLQFISVSGSRLTQQLSLHSAALLLLQHNNHSFVCLLKQVQVFISPIIAKDHLIISVRSEKTLTLMLLLLFF